MMTSKFLADAEIERRADRLLGRYEAGYGPISSAPIPVERILEDVLDLSILWDAIPEEPGQSILAGLDPNNKTVVFNESRLALIEETPGLYNTVLGHEAGHWEAHVDPALLDQTPLPHFDREFGCLFRGPVPVRIRGKGRRTSSWAFCSCRPLCCWKPFRALICSIGPTSTGCETCSR